MGPHTARQWSQGFVQGPEAHRVLFRNGRAPVAGEIFTNPDLADTFVSTTSLCKTVFHKIVKAIFRPY